MTDNKKRDAIEESTKSLRNMQDDAGLIELEESMGADIEYPEISGISGTVQRLLDFTNENWRQYHTTPNTVDEHNAGHLLARYDVDESVHTALDEATDNMLDSKRLPRIGIGVNTIASIHKAWQSMARTLAKIGNHHSATISVNLNKGASAPLHNAQVETLALEQADQYALNRVGFELALAHDYTVISNISTTALNTLSEIAGFTIHGTQPSNMFVTFHSLLHLERFLQYEMVSVSRVHELPVDDMHNNIDLLFRIYIKSDTLLSIIATQ